MNEKDQDKLRAWLVIIDESLDRFRTGAIQNFFGSTRNKLEEFWEDCLGEWREFYFYAMRCQIGTPEQMIFEYDLLIAELTLEKQLRERGKK